MKLKTLLQETQTTLFKGKATQNPEITSLCYDSRKCISGSLFFATDGIHTDGHLFIESAIKKGAIAFVISKELPNYDEDCYDILVDSPRVMMSPFAAAFYNYPANELRVIGVTGTDGKSSTVSFIHQLLELAGESAGFLSTVEYQAGNTKYPNVYRQSTPEAIEIHSILDKMRKAGNQFAVLETTSHALSPINNRVGDIPFSATVFTNVTTEHLDFHGTVEQYRKDKANLFRLLIPNRSSFGIIHGDDPWASIFIDACPATSITYGKDTTKNNAVISKIKKTFMGFSYIIEENGEKEPITININGEFNILNITAALLTVKYLTKQPLKKLITLTESIQAVDGRMNTISHKGEFNLIIDYAHTPGSFERLFPEIKEITAGKVISVFGSAGERDQQKRALQGAIADEFSDIIILTDEDPRLEESDKIINQIAQGCQRTKAKKNLYKINNRIKAIEKAISLAKKGDTLLLLGKGHESSMIYSDGKHEWSEKKVAQQALKAVGLL